MSARNLLPAAAELAEPVASAVPPTTREGLYARVVLVYVRGRQRLASLRR
jgi:hypothetical protein